MTGRAIATVSALIWIILGAGRAAAEPARARELPASVTLDRALELLRERSPRSRADQARVDIAAAERVAASVYPNPSLSYGALSLVHGENTGAAWQHQVVIEQPLLLFGQRGVREKAADLDVRAERALVSASLAERALAVRQAFATLLARQAQVEMLEESVTELSQLERIVRGRQEAGDRSVYDVARIELETTTLRVELESARTEAEDASGGLAALLGFPGWRPRGEGDLTPRELPTSLDELWRTAQRQRPTIAAAQAREASARGGLTLARRERLPVPALALGAVLTQRERSASVFFGLSLPLPLFDRGQGAVARATAELHAGTRAVEAEIAETLADLERARTVYLRQRETLRTIEQQMVDRIPALRRMAEEAYRGGTAGVLELLDSFRSVREIRLAHLARREAAKLAEASLIAIAGLEPLEPAGGRRR